MSIINRIKIFFNITPRCSHEFKGKDMHYRNELGIVKWPCYKCGKLFKAECGLDTLNHGKCIGEWGE